MAGLSVSGSAEHELEKPVASRQQPHGAASHQGARVPAVLSDTVGLREGRRWGGGAVGSGGTTEARGTAPVTGHLGTSPAPLLGLRFLTLGQKPRKESWETRIWVGSRYGCRLYDHKQRPRGLGPARSQPWTPSGAPALPTLARATRPASPPAGLLGSPRPSCPSTPHQAHFFPKVRQAARSPSLNQPPGV